MAVDSLAKELLYTTTRLTNYAPGRVSRGTGFFFEASLAPGRTLPVIVTNKHVLEGAESVAVEFVNQDPALSPPQPTSARSTVVNKNLRWVGHPDPQVDVAAFFALESLQLPDEKPFIRTVDRSFFPDAETEESLDAIEELTFIGYPNGWMDERNGTPIVRQAITATPLYQDFDGEPTFLLDGSVFGGSSGSPVFLYDRSGVYFSKGTTVAGIRCFLVGIVASTKVRHEQLPIAVATAPHTKMARELNLGVAYSWRSIEQTVDELCRVNGLNRSEP